MHRKHFAHALSAAEALALPAAFTLAGATIGAVVTSGPGMQFVLGYLLGMVMGAAGVAVMANAVGTSEGE